jgi:hypothetical protein
MEGSAAQTALVAFYPFNGNVNDASGNGLTGVVTGSPTFANNAPFGGQAIQFDGSTNSFVTIPLDIDPAAVPQITFGAWVNASPATVTSDVIRGLISNDDGDYDRTLDIDTRNGGLQWSAFIGGSVVANGAVTANTWTFLAVRYNQTANSYAFNVNGSQIAGTTNFDNTNVTTGTTIGRNPNFDSPFGGEMADAFVFNQVLTDQQIANIQANGPSAILALGGSPTPAGTVPEPGTSLLVSGGLLIAVGMIRRKR